MAQFLEKCYICNKSVLQGECPIHTKDRKFHIGDKVSIHMPHDPFLFFPAEGIVIEECGLNHNGHYIYKIQHEEIRSKYLTNFSTVFLDLIAPNSDTGRIIYDWLTK